MRRLRLQLIAILVLAMLLPLLPAAFAARELFRRSLDPLLDPALVGGIEAGLIVTREVIETQREQWLDELREGSPLDTLAVAEVARLRLAERVPSDSASERTRSGLEVMSPPEIVVSDSAATLVARVRGQGGEAVWVEEPLPDLLARRASAIDRGLTLLMSMRREHSTLLGGFVATFVAIYLAMLAIVLASVLLVISRLTRPLSELSLGIDRVATGDLTTRVPEQGSAEVAELMRHFNAMVSRLQSQQAELARLERLAAWRQMARFLAHEIKNPLTPIQLAAEQMRDAYRGDDAAYRRLVDESSSIIQEEVAGLRNWVTEFSQFARLPEPQRTAVDPHEFANELLGLYGPARLDVRVAMPGGARLHCDRDQIKRALVNLIDNAIAAQREIGGSEPVELTFEAVADGGARIRVRDHGPGIPVERRRQVFELDYTTKSDGMGLGLAIVETIVRQHEGTIAVIEAGARGATFELSLPGPGASGGQAT